MKINVKDLEIELIDDQNYIPFSASNLIDYDFKFISEDNEAHQGCITSKVGIIVRSLAGTEQKLINSAIICETGVATGIYNDTFLTDANSLLVCVCDKVYSISLPTLKLNWRIKADEATCFTIHRFGNGYIIHGELAITHLNKSGEILWQFMARDIFVTIDSEKELKIIDDIIIVKDWSEHEYHLNAEGKIIQEFKPTHKI